MHNDSVVVGDFGLSQMGVDVTNTQVGTPINMAPEILKLDKKQGYNSKADIWSIGVVFFQMLMGQYPFDGETKDALYEDISKFSGEKLRFPRWTISECKDLLQRMLTMDSK